MYSGTSTFHNRSLGKYAICLFHAIKLNRAFCERRISAILAVITFSKYLQSKLYTYFKRRQVIFMIFTLECRLRLDLTPRLGTMRLISLVLSDLTT